ncbi:MAG: hypothetical protein AAFQ67_02450, partial [Pseudomonadota bacterium]
LGARFDPAFTDGVSATTWYGGVAGLWRVSEDWSVFGRASTGVTQARAESGDLLRGADALVSSQFSIGIGRVGMFDRSDRLTLSVNQPLTVERGALLFSLPTDFDVATDQILFSDVRQPVGGAREIDFELGYSFAGVGGWRNQATVLHQSFVGGELGDATTLLLRTSRPF